MWSNSTQTNQGIYISNAGAYSFTVIDSNFCQDFSDTIAFIIDDYSSIISLGNDTSFCSGNSIELVAGNSQTVSYLWNNGQTSPSIVIDTSGLYWLQSMNSNSCNAFDSINVTIFGDAPSINLTFPDSICQLVEFQFNDFSTVPSPGNIDSIHWDFGDGQVSNLSNGNHNYIDSGYYNVSISLSTDQGCFNDSSFNVLVHPKPNVLYSYTGNCDYDTILFTSTNLGNNLLNSFVWNFDDSLSGGNNLDSVSSPSHIFTCNC